MMYIAVIGASAVLGVAIAAVSIVYLAGLTDTTAAW